MDSLGDTVVITSKKGVIEYVNPAFEKITGYSKKEVLGKTPAILNSGKHNNNFYQNLWKTILSGKTFKGTFTNKKKDGSLYYTEETITPVKDTEGNIQRFVSVGKDATIRKAIEKRKDNLISFASHELKTPLTSLKIYIDLLKKKFDRLDKVKAVRYLSKIDTKANELNNLINDYLDLNRLKAGQLQLNIEKVNADLLVDQLVEDLGQMYPKSFIVVEGSFGKEIPLDKFRFQQVVNNLVINAIKYSPKNSQIVVKKDLKNNQAHFSVKDNGIGITKKDQSKLFRSFFRSQFVQKENIPGSGLGLSLTQEIIKLHKGKIILKSAPKEGTVVTVSLPL
jgi:two-component system, OmpR family, sensor histidine kinase VicK